MKFYLLDGDKKPYNVTLEESYKLYDNPEMKITKQEYIGNILVSTVFLGTDHSFGESEIPVLWETMVFGGHYNEYQRRYTSHEDALKGHNEIINMINPRN
jgi:hypothetical protein